MRDSSLRLGDVVRRDSELTRKGHRSNTGDDPEGYSAATCTITTTRDDKTVDTQTIGAGNLYVAYSAFTGSGDTQQSQILFTRSTDCGVSWSTPKNLSIGLTLNQNAQIAVSPTTGHVFVSWRRFRSGTEGDAVFVARSVDGRTAADSRW